MRPSFPAAPEVARSRFSTPKMEGNQEARRRSGLGMRKSGLPSAPDSEAPTAAPMAAFNPWDPVQPTAAGTMLARGLSTGVVSQEVLDTFGKPAPCFVGLSEAEKIADIQTQLSQVTLDIEILQMEKDTADITHPFYLTQKSQALQAMNRHLEALLKEKKALRQRLAKPLCRESLPIEVVFQRYATELLTLAVTFIEKLETHLTTVRSIPQIPLNMKNMDSALAKMDLLVTGTEKLAEQILQWRAKQKDLFSDNSQIPAESDSGFRSRTLE